MPAASPYEAARPPTVQLGTRLTDAADPATWAGSEPPVDACRICHTRQALTQFGDRPRIVVCRPHADAALRRLGPPRRDAPNECPRHAGNVPAAVVWPLRTFHTAGTPTIPACIDCFAQSVDELAAEWAADQENPTP